MQNFNPQPNFSSDNPYWKPERFLFVFPEYRPKMNAQDFMYASTWEIYKRDIHGAACVRTAMQRSFWINLRFSRLIFKEKPKDAK
jgi:hypothetical protein